MNKTLKIVLITIGSLFVLGIGGCVALILGTGAVIDTAVEEVEKQEVANDNALTEMLDAAEITESEDMFSKNVTVKMVNTTGEFLDYVELSYSVYDAAGTKIDGFIGNASDIQPGQAFTIDFMIIDENAHSYTIDEIGSW